MHDEYRDNIPLWYAHKVFQKRVPNKANLKLVNASRKSTFLVKSCANPQN